MSRTIAALLLLVGFSGSAARAWRQAHVAQAEAQRNAEQAAARLAAAVAERKRAEDHAAMARRVWRVMAAIQRPDELTHEQRVAVSKEITEINDVYYLLLVEEGNGHLWKPVPRG